MEAIGNITGRAAPLIPSSRKPAAGRGRDWLASLVTTVSEYASPAEVLMRPPDRFTTTFLFNPWMSHEEGVDSAKALAQWEELRGVLEGAGVRVHLLEPDVPTSAGVFTADTALVYDETRALVLRNDGPRSHGEREGVKRWLEAAGFRTEATPPDYRLDGGNLVRLSKRLYLVGLKPGARGAAERYLAKLLRRTVGGGVLPLALRDRRFLHLDMVVGNLGGQALLVCRDALAPRSVEDLSEWLPVPLIPVAKADALRFACNTIVIGSTVITGPISDQLRATIETLGFSVTRIDLSEFYKAGGGAKCLVLPIRYGPTGPVHASSAQTTGGMN